MSGCTAVLDLGYRDDEGQPNVLHCEQRAGHPGNHYGTGWDPEGIVW